MNYEQKYNEMVQRARELHESGNALTKQQMEIVCPELRESEDERIRKFLIDILSHGTWKKEWPFSPPECIAYLEKHKEQSKEELVYRLNGLMQEYIKKGKDEAEKEHRFKCYQLFWDALEDTNFFEQKEQKPAEWNEDDEKMLNNICSNLYAIPEERDKMQKWLKSLRPSWKPSEEQMGALRVASEVGTANESWAMCVLKSLYNDLKKLM